MIELVSKHRVELAELCRQHRVHTLELFGSGTGGDFDPNRSDLDFLVGFLPLDPGAHARAYFGLLFGLEDLFDRKIDLVEITAIENPYFLKAVNQCRTVLFAA
jgi:predicted nucleotidyltransferase